MKKQILYICLFATQLVFSQNNLFKSKKHGFSIIFPNKVETMNAGIVGEVFTSFEMINDFFIMYQVSVLFELPNQPIIYNNKSLTNLFLESMIEAHYQTGYDNVKGLYRSPSLFNNKYYSMNYEYQGNWKQANGLPVYSRGIIIARKQRLYKVTVIYSKELHETKKIDIETNNFINSFNFIERK